MRKILLATTALVGFVAAGAAQAATAPLNVTVGGSVDFVAAQFHEAQAARSTAAGVNADATANAATGDFETIYSLAFGVTGKAANGMEYGGNLVMDNDVDAINSYGGNSNTVAVTRADVFVSGMYGKIQLGDSRGATDLAVGAPSVGGTRYTDFLNTYTSFAKDYVFGIDGKDHSTNATYYTPKVSGEYGKVQAAITFVPNFTQYGSTVTLDAPTGVRNVIKGAIAYNGNIKSVAVNASSHIVNGTRDGSESWAPDFTAWGVGVAGAYQGFTLGATFTDNGDFGKTNSQQTDGQFIATAGLKYEFGKYAVGFDYLNAEGYSTAAFLNDRVKNLNVYNFGGAYTWAPGLTTTANVVFFDQDAETGANDNNGHVFLLSQKLAF